MTILAVPTTNLERYTMKLAARVQRTWEEQVRKYYSDQLKDAKAADLRDNLNMHLEYQREGVYNYGRNYRVDERPDRYAIVYDDNASGMPKIHCVVSKETGDVARACIKLVKEPYFNYNLLDERSRHSCYSHAHYNGDYLL